MNCRRVNNLLSAYVDAELTGAEMLEIRGHLARCSACQREHEALQQTKRLLGALALRTPRCPTEFEQVLLQTAQTVQQKRQRSPMAWLLPPSLLAWHEGSAAVTGGTTARLRTATTALAMSVAGLLLATTALDRSGDHRTAALDALTSGPIRLPGAAAPSANRQAAAAVGAAVIAPPGYGVYPPYVAPHAVRAGASWEPAMFRFSPDGGTRGPGSSPVRRPVFYPAADNGLNDGYRYFSTLVSR